jgi:3-phosphoshikimate 1-carboxyvinyltransferase
LGLLSEESTIEEPLLSEDPRATLSTIEALGAKIERGRSSEGGEVFSIHGGAVRTPEDILDAKNSGTTLRIATAVASLAPQAAVLTGDASLRKRPMAPLLAALGPLGVDAFATRANGCAPVVVRGPLRGGSTSIAGDVSSQYVTALILAGLLSPDGVRLRLTSPLKSRPYVDITLAMIRRFGGSATSTPEVFDVPGRQKLGGARYRVPGDWSSAAFPLAAAAISGGDVTVTNLDPNGEQGDRRILEFLRSFGAKVETREDGARVVGQPLCATNLDLADTPDLFPILCALAAHATGTTVLSGAEHLRFKESDRIRAMVQNLERMGVRCEERKDGAVIHGAPGRIRGAPTGLETEQDHRILMALAICALGASGETKFEDDASFDVSYPRFPEAMASLGLHVEVVR